MDYEFAKSTKKHGVSEDDMINIIKSKSGAKIGISREKLDKIAWVGNDKFDQKIEIIAINFITYYYIIHVMPVSKRGDEKDDYLEGLW